MDEIPETKAKDTGCDTNGLYKLRASDSTGLDISCIETGIIRKSSNVNDTVGDYSIIKLLGILYTITGTAYLPAPWSTSATTNLILADSFPLSLYIGITYTLMYSTFIPILRSLNVLLRFVFSFSSAFLTSRTMSLLSVAASVTGR
jgi:hypothetical protein